MLGLAFDPQYATNRRFYLNYVAPGVSFGQGVSQIAKISTAQKAAKYEFPV